MSDIDLHAAFGPQYNIVFNEEETSPPFTVSVGTGFNVTGSSSTVSGTLNVKITAARVLNAFRAVGYDGEFSLPTEASLSTYAGVTRVSASTGETINVVRSGLITENSWTWTPNQPIFISDQGVLTQTLPVGAIRRIGWAISPTQLNLDPYPIIGV